MKKYFKYIFIILILLGVLAFKYDDFFLDDDDLVSVERPIIGGYEDVLDHSVTSELSDIFNNAIKNTDKLDNDEFEPLELLQTALVGGTNYKFLAKCVKSNTYIENNDYIVIVNVDLDGNCVVISIEEE